MPLVVRSRRTNLEKLRGQADESIVVDVTSRGPEPWVRFSPFYPHGGIPIPFLSGRTGLSVEGIWQGLKVFEHAGVDPEKWRIETMRGIKRSARRYGRVLGHRAGLDDERLLAYREARYAIYLPCYRWVLENPLADLVEELRRLGDERAVILLDYETNEDVDDLTRPLSHAGLIKRNLEGTWPAPTDHRVTDPPARPGQRKVPRTRKTLPDRSRRVSVCW